MDRLGIATSLLSISSPGVHLGRRGGHAGPRPRGERGRPPAPSSTTRAGSGCSPRCRCPTSTRPSPRSPTAATASTSTASRCSPTSAAPTSATRRSSRCSASSTGAAPGCSSTRRRRRAGSTRRSGGPGRCSSSSSTPPAPWSTWCSTAPSPATPASSSSSRTPGATLPMVADRVSVFSLLLDVDPDVDVLRDLGRLHFDLAGLPAAPPARRAPHAHHARPPPLRERLPLHARVRGGHGRRAPGRGRRPAGLGARRAPRQHRTPLPRARPTGDAALTRPQEMPMQHQLELGYLVLEVPDPDVLRPTFAEVVGLVAGEPTTAGAATWRDDGRASRVVVQAGPANDAVAVGFEAVDAAAFAATVARLQGLGLDVADDARGRGRASGGSPGAGAGAVGHRRRGGPRAGRGRRRRSRRPWCRVASSPTAWASGTSCWPRRPSTSRSPSSPTGSGSSSRTGSRWSWPRASPSRCASSTATPATTPSPWLGRRSSCRRRCTT